MPASLLSMLKFFLIALIWLFFLRVLRAVWVEVMAPAVAPPERNRQAGAPPKVPKAERTSRAAEAAAPRQVPARTGPASGGLRLEVVEPRGREGEGFALDGADVTMGRALGCGISLSFDNYVSQVHARLFTKGGEPHIEDLGSTNGTYLNGERISSAVALVEGDRVQMGRTVLQVTR